MTGRNAVGSNERTRRPCVDAKRNSRFRREGNRLSRPNPPMPGATRRWILDPLASVSFDELRDPLKVIRRVFQDDFDGHGNRHREEHPTDAP